MTGTSVATRIAVKLQPPTVYLEYSAADKGDRRVRAVRKAWAKVSVQAVTDCLKLQIGNQFDKQTPCIVLRQVKLAKLATSYNSSYLDKLTNKARLGLTPADSGMPYEYK